MRASPRSTNLPKPTCRGFLHRAVGRALGKGTTAQNTSAFGSWTCSTIWSKTWCKLNNNNIMLFRMTIAIVMIAIVVIATRTTKTTKATKRIQHFECRNLNTKELNLFTEAMCALALVSKHVGRHITSLVKWTTSVVCASTRQAQKDQEQWWTGLSSSDLPRRASRPMCLHFAKTKYSTT